MSIRGILRLAPETLFGRGSIASLAPLVGGLGRHALVCTDRNVAAQPAVAAALVALAGTLESCTVFDEVEPDLPVATIERAVAAAAGRGIDVVVGIGGGSSLDAAKTAALLLRHPGPLERYYGEGAVPGPVAPIVAVPTTAGTGSEVTPVAVVADPARRLKVGVSSAHLIPRAAICDPELTLSCPPAVTAVSGIDALAHAVEAFTARVRPRDWARYPGDVFQGRTTMSDLFALTAIRAIGANLERAHAEPADLEAREQMLYGSLCAGIAFGNAGTAGAHALQYPIGALTKTPHGLGVGLLLPYVLRYVEGDCRQQLAQVGAALGVAPDAGAAIAEIARLAAAVGIPRTLAEIGVGERDLPGVAAEAAAITRLVANSPRELDVAAMEVILRAAWSGNA